MESMTVGNKMVTRDPSRQELRPPSDRVIEPFAFCVDYNDTNDRLQSFEKYPTCMNNTSPAAQARSQKSVH